MARKKEVPVGRSGDVPKPFYPSFLYYRKDNKFGKILLNKRKRISKSSTYKPNMVMKSHMCMVTAKR